MKTSLAFSIAAAASCLCACLLVSVHAQGRPISSFAAAREMAASGDGLRAWDPAIDRMERAGALRLRDMRVDHVLTGRSHERYAQYYQGIRVIGGDVVRQMDHGASVSILGQLYEGVALDSRPALTPENVLELLRQLTGGSLVREPIPELVIVPLEGGPYALAYRARVLTGTDRLVYFIDAQNGRVILSYSDLQRDSVVGVGSGVFGDAKKVSANRIGGTFFAEDLLRPAEISTFDMKGNTGRTRGFLEGGVALGVGDLTTTTDNKWTDGPDVDAHVYAGYTYDYYYKRFGLHGLDDRNIPITVLVHPARRANLTTASPEDVGLFYLNAFYAGDATVAYGEGLPSGFVLSDTGQTVDYFAAGLDVVAHELSHGVTEFSSGLVYLNESGALNEAFSDIMGVSVKFFFRTPGSAVMQANYELGADVVRPGGLRSFDNPGAFGDPDHYSKRVIGTADNGGVHTNCTIVDHAFYLAIEGGVNRTSGLAVQGVGSANREQIEKAFYRGFTLMLPANASFSLARAATIQSARDLYGVGSPPDRALTQAWTAVGVN